MCLFDALKKNLNFLLVFILLLHTENSKKKTVNNKLFLCLKLKSIFLLLRYQVILIIDITETLTFLKLFFRLETNKKYIHNDILITNILI